MTSNSKYTPRDLVEIFRKDYEDMNKDTIAITAICTGAVLFGSYTLGNARGMAWAHGQDFSLLENFSLFALPTVASALGWKFGRTTFVDGPFAANTYVACAGITSVAAIAAELAGIATGYFGGQ